MIAKQTPSVNPSILANRTLIDAGNIPRELQTYRQFVAWRYVDRGRPKLDKCPVNVRTLGNAGPTWPNTWASLPAALACYEAHQSLAGVGFVLAPNDPYTMIDLDACVTAGSLNDFAQAIVERLDTYVEYSPSGCGLRFLVRCEAQPPALKRPEIEIYSRERFATLTGNVVHNVPIARADLRWLYDHFAPTQSTATSDPRLSFSSPNRLAPSPIDAELWQYIFRINSLAQPLFHGDLSSVFNKNNGRPDQSRAVILLLNSLAIWTNGDAQRMDRMIRMTHLDQSKWDDKRGNRTWLEGRIADAIAYIARGNK